MCTVRISLLDYNSEVASNNKCMTFGLLQFFLMLFIQAEVGFHSSEPMLIQKISIHTQEIVWNIKIQIFFIIMNSEKLFYLKELSQGQSCLDFLKRLLNIWQRQREVQAHPPPPPDCMPGKHTLAEIYCNLNHPSFKHLLKWLHPFFFYRAETKTSINCYFQPVKWRTLWDWFQKHCFRSVWITSFDSRCGNFSTVQRPVLKRWLSIQCIKMCFSDWWIYVFKSLGRPWLLSHQEPPSGSEKLSDTDTCLENSPKLFLGFGWLDNSSLYFLPSSMHDASFNIVWRGIVGGRGGQ